MTLTSVHKNKTSISTGVHLSVKLFTPLAPVPHPCKSPKDFWASGAWRGSRGRCQWERGGWNPRRRKRRTRHSNIPSRLCLRSQSCVWLIVASPPVRWRHRGLVRRERCEHNVAIMVFTVHSAASNCTHRQRRKTCQQVWGGSLFLFLYQSMSRSNTETPGSWRPDWRWR